MKSARIPHHILNPGESIIHSIGCREDGTFSECSVLITRQFVYVVGNFLMRENCTKVSGMKGFKVIDINSVYDIKEITARHPALIILFLIFTSMLVLFETGYKYIHPVTIFSIIQTAVFAGSVSFLMLFIFLKKKYVRISYKSGYIQFRNRLFETGAVQKAKDIIFKYKNCNIVLED